MVLGDARDADPEAWAETVGRPLLACGNLPYYLSTEIAFFLLDHHASFERAVLMFQKEVADRIRAAPGGKEYGILSVLVQYRCAVERVMDVPPTCFYPPPEVVSAVLGFRFRKKPEPAADDEDRFAGLVKAGFGQRRKTLRNALAVLAGSAGEAEARLRAAGIDPARRAETLAVAEWVGLSNGWETNRNDE